MNFWQLKTNISRGLFDGEFAVDEIQERTLTVQNGLHGDASSPELVQVAQAFFGVFELEIATVMVVLEQQYTVIVVIGIFYFDYGNGAGTDILNQRFLDLAPVLLVGDPAHHLLITTAFVLEQIELANEIFGQITTQKRRIALDLAHLE